MKTQALLMTILTVSCGVQPTEQTPTETKKIDLNTAIATSTQLGKQDDVLDTEEDGVKASFLVAKKDQIKCVTEIEGQLIYSREDAQFYFCEKQAWVLIDLKGKDGVNGKDGQDGKNGTDGKDGKDGAKGKDGSNGIAGKDGEDGKDTERQADENQWINPVDNSLWFLGLYASETNVYSQRICPTKARAVTAEEVEEAYRSGLTAKLAAYFLTNTGGSSYGFYFNNKDKGTVEIMMLNTVQDKIQAYALSPLSTRKYYSICVID